MQHVDPDRLTLLALNEPADVDDVEATAHLTQCVLCRTEVETLRQTVELARETVEYRDEGPQAPEAVWTRISEDLGFADSSAASEPGAGRTGHFMEHRDRHVDGDLSGDGGELSGSTPTGDSTGGGDVAGESPSDRPVAPDGRVAGDRGAAGAAVFKGDREVAGTGVLGGDRGVVEGPGGERGVAGAALFAVGSRRSRLARAAGALVAAVAVGVVGTLVAVRPWDSGTGVPAVASSTASLEPVTGGPGGVSGRAVVREGESGPELDVSAAGLPLQQGYYEVWVFDGGRNMVSVGVLGPDSTAALPLPPTLDLRTYHVVDISQERYDGDQTHSKTSVLRGTLTG